jgi:outer membrane protein assembly factor BamB
MIGLVPFSLTTQRDSRAGVPFPSVVRASPIIVNGVLYVARDHELSAYDTRTGEKLWSDDAIGTIHWQSPIIVNNAIFIADNEGYITAYTLDASAK